MTRTVIALEPNIKKWLDERALQEGVPMTELVRRALRQFRDEEDRSVGRILNDTSGIWTAGDGLEYQETSRAEWGN